MKKILALMLCFTLASTMSFAKDKKKNKETVTFLVEDIHCEKCIKAIEGNIAFEKGVTRLKSDLETRTIKVTYRPSKTNVETLQKAFEKIKKPAVIYVPEKK